MASIRSRTTASYLGVVVKLGTGDGLDRWYDWLNTRLAERTRVTT